MKFIPNAVSSKLVRQVLLVQKNSPTLLFGAGVVGVIVTVVLASRATLRMEEVIDETQTKLDAARDLHAKGHASYTDNDYKQDVALIYAQSAGNVTKLYAPSIVVGVLSIGALSGSHIILTRRNVAVTAAYAAVEKGFSEYRARVLNDVGEDKEREYRYGTINQLVTKKTKKGEVVETVKRVGPDGASIYARFFDNRSSSWNPQPEYNMMFLRAQQNYANDKLQARGHVLLNDVYDSLGIERSKEGCVVGWRTADGGDNYIDFGIFEGQHMDRFYDFVTGAEGAILLDFNVDGLVYDKI